MLPTPAPTPPAPGTFLPGPHPSQRTGGHSTGAPPHGEHRVLVPRSEQSVDGVRFVVQKAQIPPKRKAFPFLRGRASKSDPRAAACVKSVPVTLQGGRPWGLQSGGSPVYLPVAQLIWEARGAASPAGSRPSWGAAAAPASQAQPQSPAAAAGKPEAPRTPAQAPRAQAPRPSGPLRGRR